MDNERVLPIPKSLSNNANLSESSDDQGNRASVTDDETETKVMFTPRIDEKLTILKQEMTSLRQVDFDLLTQLTQLRQSIDDLKQEMTHSLHSYSNSNSNNSNSNSNSNNSNSNNSNSNNRRVMNGSTDCYSHSNDDAVSDEESSQETASSH